MKLIEIVICRTEKKIHYKNLTTKPKKFCTWKAKICELCPFRGMFLLCRSV